MKYKQRRRWPELFLRLSLQVTVLRCCLPEQRMFRASNSSVLFHFMLLLGLAMAAVTLGFNFYLGDPEQPLARAYAEAWTRRLQANALLIGSFFPLPAASRAHARCLTSQPRAWPVSPAQHRPPSAT